MIAIKKGTIKYVLVHWKIFVHLLLRTKHFGVNNNWWEKRGGFMGLPLWKVILRIILIYPLIHEYWAIRFRATHNKFLSEESCDLLGWNMDNSPGFFNVIAMNNPLFLLKWLFRKENK